MQGLFLSFCVCECQTCIVPYWHSAQFARVHVNYSTTVIFFSSVYPTLEADATVQVEESRSSDRWAEPRHHFPSLSGLHCHLVDRVVFHLEADLFFFFTFFFFLPFFVICLFFFFFYFFFLYLHRATFLHDVSFQHI